MRMRWKLLGLAGVAGVAATGVMVARNRRSHPEMDPDELRDRLHRRLAEISPSDGHGHGHGDGAGEAVESGDA
jgi:hypothetical protein